MAKKIKLTEKINEKKQFKNFSFETYRNMDENYWQNNLVQKEPSAINFLSYRKYKVTIELIEETNETLINRLLELLNKTDNHYHASSIKSELRKLGHDI